MSNMPRFQDVYLDAAVRASIDPVAFRAAAEEVLPTALRDQALSAIPKWDGYAPTRLAHLPGLAGSMGVSGIWCKDEGDRFGLGSFKALGGAHAVRTLATARKEGLTVACATEGNHGRSVAWGAQQVGAHCVIFLHEKVSQAREEAIATYGAEIRRVRGNYDDAVRACARIAEDEGWTIVSDTTWPGYEEIPRIVMAGYSVMVKEIKEQLPEPPTHVFLQAGVGGMAAAVMAACLHYYGASLPRFVIVEPRAAACILASIRAGGAPVAVEGELRTVTAGLACGEPSPLALSVINAGAHAVVAVDDRRIIESMQRFARPFGADEAIVAGASGAAGLAGLLAVEENPRLRDVLHLSADSRILLINTESDTDKEAYRRLVQA